MSNYVTAREAWKVTGIYPRSLKHARLKKQITDIKWSPGGRIPYFNVEEIRRVFPNAKIDRALSPNTVQHSTHVR